MNEQLQNALIDIIGKVNSGIDASVSFLSAEIPDVLHQLLVWYAVQSAIECIVGMLIIAAGAKIFTIKFGKSKEQALSDYESGKQWTRYCGSDRVTSTEYDWIMAMPDHWKAKALGAVASIIGIAWISIDWLKILIAPKIWLIEYASHLAK